MALVKKSEEQFTDMNDFFVRELKPEARPVAGYNVDGSEDATVIASAADCRLMCFPT